MFTMLALALSRNLHDYVYKQALYGGVHKKGRSKFRSEEGAMSEVRP
jgi:hypothetical protein